MKKTTLRAYGNIWALDFDGQEITCNSKPTGRQAGFLNYFDCTECKNQVIGEDEQCNRFKDVYDITDTKRYCRNYE
ncbi:MAG: hypothetical protein US20_C0005G0029 [Candidatus Pacebacteria bacterium GW2011_GWF1_36_5]|nr:MAG: hypothetical protein US20_C0005G0029 [Candidatus Pacebacteria bacterium GW2011_GWF1_36_5]